MSGEDIVASLSAATEVTADVLDLAGVVERLAALAPLEYDRERESEAARLGVRVSTLDAEVRSRRKNGVPDGGGAEAVFRDPEPWPDRVDGSELLDDLEREIHRYLVLPAAGGQAAALWILHAHLHHTAWISPILAITSPSPECGKTTLLELLGALVPRPLPASNISAAAIFRSVEKWAPTVLIDEADTFLRDSDELRGVLNSGHRRSAAYVVRTVGDDHEPRHFATWAPKAIALIGKLPATLDSRSIEIELRRKTIAEQVEELRSDRLHHLEPLLRRCARFAQDVATRVASADPALPPSLHGRGADNWRHLIAIADAAGGAWPSQARAAAVAATATRSGQTSGIYLLEDLRMVFGERGVERLSSAEIVQVLNLMEDRPWSEWKNGKPLSVRQLAHLLEPFRVAPTKFRAAGYTAGTRGYEWSAFADAFARYLPESGSRSATTPQANDSAICDAIYPPQAQKPVADEDALKPSNPNGCGVVADQTAAVNEREQDAFEERAAIVQFDGGMERSQAEALAMKEVRPSRLEGDAG